MVHEVLSFCVLIQCETSFKKIPACEKNETLQNAEDLMMEKMTTKTQKNNKKEFSLPNVKELAKQFTLQETQNMQRTGNGLRNNLENRQKARPADTSVPGREPELDYSTTPVSEIISNLQQSTQTPIQANKHVPYENIRPKTQIEICRKTNPDDDKKAGAGRFNGKQVHSLTARSISKEFREGLKNNSYQNVFLKINRTAENEQRDVVYTEEQKSPTPSIDLKNMKKFWEEIITANTNATKQK